MGEKRKFDRKKDRIIMIVGIVLLVVGIIMLIVNISIFVDAKRAYEAEYDIWFDKWWNEHTANLNDQPDDPTFSKIAGIVVSAFWVFISLFITLIGAVKLMSKKSMDIKGEIMAKIHTVKPEVSKEEIADEPTTRRKRECEYCGAKLTKNSDICNYCGKEN